MPKISIDVNSTGSEVYLRGDITALKKHRYAWGYVKDYLRPIESADKIAIPVGDEEPVVVLTKVRDMLNKYKFTEAQSESSNKILLDFYEEEQKFSAFSKKAEKIRNNECDTQEFHDFTNAVAVNLSNRSLYPLQLLSSYHLAFSQNACNFSAPGAGKTSIVYGAYAYLHSLSKNHPKYVDRLLIVGPLSSFGPWELEYTECFGRSPSVKRLISSISKSEKEAYLISGHTCELTLVSYASLVSLEKYVGFFLRNNRVMVVLDEAHKAKNSSGGVIAQTVLNLAKYCSARVVLTGTPAPNGYEDIYNMNDDSDEMIFTRERIVQEFQKPDCPFKVIIANPFAVAESISLHKACHNAIYMERSFNAAHFVQSKDRIHRYGLAPGTETNYFYVLSRDSVDETIDTRLSEKEQRMTAIMESMPIPLFNNVSTDLGDEDIKALIKDYVRRTKKA